MNLEKCKFYNKETGCIECKQAIVENLAEIICWQQQKFDEIIETCKEAMKTYDDDEFYEDDLDYFMGQSQMAEEILEIIVGIEESEA